LNGDGLKCIGHHKGALFRVSKLNEVEKNTFSVYVHFLYLAAPQGLNELKFLIAQKEGKEKACNIVRKIEYFNTRRQQKKSTFIPVHSTHDQLCGT
jgi:hypothetical protein